VSSKFKLLINKLMKSAIGTVLSGGLISALGHYVPFILAGGILTTIGTGLIYTLQVASKSSHWIGYQVIAGFGIGLAFQIPMIVAQSICELSEVSHVTAITLCKLPPKKSRIFFDCFSFSNDGWHFFHFHSPVDFRKQTSLSSWCQCPCT
jgi:hypothetical protein